MQSHVATFASGAICRDTEFFRVKGSKITEIEIYCGARMDTVGGKE